MATCTGRLIWRLTFLMAVIYLLISSLIYSQLVCLQVTSNYAGKIGLFLLCLCFLMFNSMRMLPLVMLEMYLELFVSVVHSYIFSLCVSIWVNDIIFYLILFVCYHIPFCTALKEPNCFINCMELIQGSQICKGKLWYEIVSMKR